MSPAAVFASRIKARPAMDRTPTWFRVRQDRVSKAGNVTVRYLSRLRHIGVGRAPCRRCWTREITACNMPIEGRDEWLAAARRLA